MKRFLKDLFKHPGTWVLGSIVLVGVAIAVPPAAPALLIAAAVGTGAAGVASAPYFWWGLKKHLFRRGEFDLDWVKQRLSIWITKHPLQVIVVGLALALFITALVLTIGFFTGGVGFAFMAPVFAAGAAAAVGGVSLPAILATTFVIAPLTLGNNLKRFLGWLDSFKYVAVPAIYNAVPNRVNLRKDKSDTDDDSSHEDVDNDEKSNELPNLVNLRKDKSDTDDDSSSSHEDVDNDEESKDWGEDGYTRADTAILGSPSKYFGAVFKGMKETIVNGFARSMQRNLIHRQNI